MNLSIFIVIFVFFELCVIIGGIFAYKDRFFSVSQMRAGGISQGLPYIANGNVWADFFIITPLISVLGAYYFSIWSAFGIIFSVFAGIVVSIVMHLLYAKTDIPESAFSNKKLTKSGWAHCTYMSGALAVFFLFFFFTPALSFNLYVIVSVVLVLHILIANHLILEITKPEWWGNSKFKTKELILSVCVLLVLLIIRGYFI